jgi:2-desacetyl-2-hydroxyethyl bacteriochlorophyllide A dehydrogenase
MLAVTLESPGTFRPLQIAEPPRVRPGEALVRVRCIGVCGTDHHAYLGQQPFFTYPRILGHELGVEVVALGEPEAAAERLTNRDDAARQRLRPGHRCALQPYLNCGRCPACRRGRPNCCARLQVLGVHVDGGMRELLIVPADKLHPADELSFEQLALSETLGIGAHAVRRAQLRADDTVLVVGLGPVGLGVALFASMAGVRVAAIEPFAQRAEFAQARIPGLIALANEGNPEEKLRAAFDGELPSVVFDCTGNRAAMERSFHFVAHGGKLVFVGLVLGPIQFEDPLFHAREMTLLASRNAMAEDTLQALAALRAGRIDASSWITHRARLDDVPRVFPEWIERRNEIIKAVVEL